MTYSGPGRSNKLHNAPTGLPTLLTIGQVADATGLSAKTIRRRVSDGTLLAHRIGPRCIRIELGSVLQLLRAPLGLYEMAVAEHGIGPPKEDRPPVDH
jgi:excisionase family DNA binding protein